MRYAHKALLPSFGIAYLSILFCFDTPALPTAMNPPAVTPSLLRSSGALDFVGKRSLGPQGVTFFQSSGSPSQSLAFLHRKQRSVRRGDWPITA